MGENSKLSLRTSRTDPKKSVPKDIRERAFEFAVTVVNLSRFLNNESDVPRSMIDQLLRSGTSVGANLEEAFASESRADFIHKNSVSLKEARECGYWLRLIVATTPFSPNVRTRIESIHDESGEISRIIGKIVVTSRANATQRPR